MYGFEVKFGDVTAEATFLLISLYCFLTALKHKDVLILAIGWGIYSFGVLFDVVDEFDFILIPEQLDDYLEDMPITLGVLLIAYVFLQLIERKEEILEKLQYLYFHDLLTGLQSRYSFEKIIKSIDAYKNYPISIIVCDINNLKKVNDHQGINQLNNL